MGNRESGIGDWRLATGDWRLATGDWRLNPAHSHTHTTQRPIDCPAGH
ncbi:N-acetylmuramoyl-L-alanine amidase [Xanthomonas oryzae pv. oryzae]|nr:N-acetylmuramoyl-L-alanine amidase [Xanthomonas oryzae pv. oryzae]RBF85787.1 N-acetylmuramoyl-L-alanine amidase [Xanthomonas oryzae pv. oryzae]RBK67125.1 N-acetylmuramoyl-L-alanine amidase [Xanthomonas oryzae pv. oryzae]